MDIEDSRAAKPDIAAGGEGEDMALLRCIERVRRLVASETAALKNGEGVDFVGCNARKSHALLELNMLARCPPPTVTPALAAEIAALERELAENAQTLGHFLRATAEICDFAVKRLQAEEWDGTYTKQSITRP